MASLLLSDRPPYAPLSTDDPTGSSVLLLQACKTCQWSSGKSSLSYSKQLRQQKEDGVDLEMNINGRKSTFEDDEFEDMGTIIDRIDCNIQNVAASVEERYKQPQKAERTQKKGGMVMCATVLFILIFIMIVLLILKIIF